MIKYEKNESDTRKEQHDLSTSPIMRFLKNQENYKFNIGDIVLRQTRWHAESEWKTTSHSIGAPKKYMYVFENELGIGYIKQLKVDGSGFTSHIVCTANFDMETTRLVLDPDFVDHMLIGEDEFQYNREYAHKKAFRDEAIAKNRKLLIGTSSIRKRLEWFHSLKPGDEFWYGDTFDDLVLNKFTVHAIKDHPISSCPSHIRDDLENKIKLMPSYRQIEVVHNDNVYGPNAQTLTQDHFTWKRVSMSQPYPLEDALCGHQK